MRRPDSLSCDAPGPLSSTSDVHDVVRAVLVAVVITISVSLLSGLMPTPGGLLVCPYWASYCQ